MDNLFFLIIDIVFFVWSLIQLNNWLVHPYENVQRITKSLKVARKIFFFLTPFTPFGFYERNPDYMIRRYKMVRLIAVVISIIGFILAIASMIAGK